MCKLHTLHESNKESYFRKYHNMLKINRWITNIEMSLKNRKFEKNRLIMVSSKVDPKDQIFDIFAIFTNHKDQNEIDQVRMVQSRILNC